jgi:hypothetical protein
VRRPLLCTALLAALALPAGVPAAAPAASAGLAPEKVLAEVSLDEMWKVVEAFAGLDRTSSGPGERRAALYLEAALERLGVPHRLHEVRSFLSLPVSASLSIQSPEAFAVPCITPSFSASTGPGGLSGSLVYAGPREPQIVTTRPEDFATIDARGRLVLLRGYPSPELIEMAEQAGAIGAVCAAPSPRLVNMIVSTIWGHPAPGQAARLPKIPIVTVSETDGARLQSLCVRGPVAARLEARTDTGWKTIPLVVAEVRGGAEADDFVLIGNHLDSWHEGVTDSATGNGALLELARVLQAHRGALRRSVRLAWWPGHSTGRYSGSTWYADTFHRDLRDHAVAYLATDSPGVRSATEIEAEGMFEARGFLEDALRRGAGVARPATRAFRYNDESLWGIGVPSLTFYPAIPMGHPDRAKDAGGSAYGYWWHTREDTLDKADRDLLLRDTRLFLSLIWPLATRETLPFDFVPVAAQMRDTLEALSRAAAGRWDFAPTLGRIAAFEKAAVTLRSRAGAARGPSARAVNRTLMAVSRALNPALYTLRGPFDHDPAVQLPLFPGLAGAERLGSLDPDSAEAGFIRTALLRESNRVHDALERAAALAAGPAGGENAR